MFSSKPKYSADKTKVHLKMLCNRFQLLTQKKANLAKQQKRQVATLLRDDKEQNARILVEHIIREDYTLESYGILRQYAEMLLARLEVVNSEDHLKPEIAEAVCALLYAGWLYGSEIPELKVLHAQFTAKYGKEYAQEVIENKEKYLNHRLVRMLTSTQVPDPSVVELYLTEIAKAYGVDFTPKPPPGAFGAAPDPISSTIGIALPLPGMPINSAEPVAPQPAPAAPVRPAGGVALPVASASCAPAQGTSSGGAVPFTVTLTKGIAGFGMNLTPDNVVVAIKPGSEAAACGLIQPGDRVLHLNGHAVSVDEPVKSFAIDLADGAAATFSLVRHANTDSAGGAAHIPVVDGSPATPPQQPAAPAAAPPPLSADDDLARRLADLKRG